MGEHIPRNRRAIGLPMQATEPTPPQARQTWLRREIATKLANLRFDGDMPAADIDAQRANVEAIRRELDATQRAHYANYNSSSAEWSGQPILRGIDIGRDGEAVVVSGKIEGAVFNITGVDEASAGIDHIARSMAQLGGVIDNVQAPMPPNIQHWATQRSFPKAIHAEWQGTGLRNLDALAPFTTHQDRIARLFQAIYPTSLIAQDYRPGDLVVDKDGNLIGVLLTDTSVQVARQGAARAGGIVALDLLDAGWKVQKNAAPAFIDLAGRHFDHMSMNVGNSRRNEISFEMDASAATDIKSNSRISVNGQFYILTHLNYTTQRGQPMKVGIVASAAPF